MTDQRLGDIDDVVIIVDCRMRTSTIKLAPYAVPRRAPRRAPIGASAVVVLLTALFAGAILAALEPRPPVDAVQASVQGGL